VKPHTHSLRNAGLAWILCIFFFCAGHAFIPYLGIEADEALFAQGIYQPRAELYSILIGKTKIPIMLMTYVGALKSVIYAPLLRNLGVSLRTVREPMLLVGVASLWLFFLLLRRVAGDRAALIGCAILALDSLYLLTICFDWGPVAFQHLLMIGGSLALARFFQEKREGALAAAGFLFGLAMWDKALAAWMLSGIAVAGVLTFPRRILDVLTLRRLLVAVLAFCLGALPLILYNVNNQWGTFSGNFQRDTASMPRKAAFLVRSVSAGLFGWLTAEDRDTPRPHEPATALEKASARISAAAGHPRNSLLFYAFLLALLLAPVAPPGARRLIVFGFLAILVAWIQMAMNRDTGGSIHHTTLLWPLPQFVIAISFSAVSYRLGRAGIPAVAAIAAVLTLSGGLVMNEYFAQTVRNGGGQSWNDGIFALSRYLTDDPTRWVFTLDWGMSDQLRLLHRGRLLVTNGDDQVSKPEMTPEDRALVQQMLSNPGNLYVAHTPAFEFFPGNAQKLTQFATASGYRRETLAAIGDSRGRAVYEVYKFTK
jgi:hypothetical protein